MWKTSPLKITLGHLGPLSTWGPNNNNKIRITKMKSRKKTTNLNTIMNKIKIRGNKECYRNDPKMRQKTKTHKIEKNNVNSKLELS
jgi:hypothetical protein